MTRLSFLLSAFAIGLFFVANASAQCARQGGGGVPSSGGSVGIRSGFQSTGFQGGGQGGQLLTGPGSHFHDLMMQNARRQHYARQQAMLAAAKQAKRNTRKQASLETRKRQRAAELARREEKKRQAKLKAQLQTPTRTPTATQLTSTPSSRALVNK